MNIFLFSSYVETAHCRMVEGYTSEENMFSSAVVLLFTPSVARTPNQGRVIDVPVARLDAAFVIP